MDAPSKLARTMQNEGHHIHHETSIFVLPEAVFHHIISFLPLRDMAKTGICRKEWRNLCYVTPYLTINFDEVIGNPATFVADRRALTRIENFTNFVGRLLLFRKSSELLRFSLKDTTRCAHDYRIESWILFAINSCNLRELHLMLSQTLSGLPCQLLRFPPSIQWTNLEYLSLISVKLLDDPFSHWISSCRILKTMTLANCVGFTTLTVRSATLAKLKIRDPSYSQLRVLEIMCQNLETLELKLLSLPHAQSAFRIFAPRLQLFNWYGPIVRQFLARPFLLLQSATVNAFLPPLSENDHGAFLQFGSRIFSCLSHVKSLSLCGLSMKILAVTMMRRPSVSLCYVEYLKLGSHLDDPEAFLMKYILRRITTVKTLVINQDARNYPMVPISKEMYEEAKKLLGMEFIHQLKNAEMRLLRSWESNIDFVKYLLKNAKELECITLIFRIVECGVANKVSKELNRVRDKVIEERKAGQEPYSLVISVLPNFQPV